MALTPSTLPPLNLSQQVRVLVADDQPLTRMVITSMVAKAFPQAVIDTAENGEQAVAKTDATSYDMILMGILLSLEVACELCRRLVELYLT